MKLQDQRRKFHSENGKTAFQFCARHKVAGKVAPSTQTSSSLGALRSRNTTDGANLLFQQPQSVTPLQQQGKNLLDQRKTRNKTRNKTKLETKRL